MEHSASCPKGLEKLRRCKFDHFRRGVACQPYDADSLMNSFRHLIDSKLKPLP